MLVPVQYQRILTVPASQAPVDIRLEDDLPTNGLIDPKVTIFNTDATAIDAALAYVLEFGVTANPNQSGTFTYAILESEWPLPHTVGGAVQIAVGESQPLPISARVSALMPFSPPETPVRHTLTLTNSVDELVERTVRLVYSGYIDQTQRLPINNFRTYD